MKLTRKQELRLIDLGMQKLLESLDIPRKSPTPAKKKKSAWTPERRAKFSQTMKKKWANK